MTTPTTPRRSRRSASGFRTRRSRPPAARSTCGSRTAAASARSTRCATPGHAPDHLAFVSGDVGVHRRRGARRGQRLHLPRPRRARRLPRGPRAAAERASCGARPRPRPARRAIRRRSSTQYIAHRLDRERRLLEALDAGKRTADELLDDVWGDAPPVLRPAAACDARRAPRQARRGGPAAGRRRAPGARGRFRRRVRRARDGEPPRARAPSRRSAASRRSPRRSSKICRSVSAIPRTRRRAAAGS